MKGEYFIFLLDKEDADLLEEGLTALSVRGRLSERLDKIRIRLRKTIDAQRG